MLEGIPTEGVVIVVIFGIMAFVLVCALAFGGDGGPM